MSLSLALLEPGILLVDHIQAPLPSDDFTIRGTLFYRSFYLHL